MLSGGGKIILLRHVLASIPLHMVKVLSPPKSFLVTLGRTLNRLLWDATDGTHPIHWSSWENISLPVDGGIGIRSLADIIQAFNIKLRWCLGVSKSPWVHFMHQKYIKSLHPIQVERQEGSLVWKRLFDIRHTVEASIFWRLGCGLVDFYDKWVSDEQLYHYVTEWILHIS